MFQHLRPQLRCAMVATAKYLNLVFQFVTIISSFAATSTSGVVDSGDVLSEPRNKILQCENPKGKVGTAILYDCGQAVFKGAGNKADWNICPEPVNEATVEEIQKKVKETETTVKETEKTINKIEKKVNETEIIIKEMQKLLLKIAKTNDNQFTVLFDYHPEFNIKKNNLVTELAFLGKEYIVTFNLLLTTLSSSTLNILHLTIGGDYGVYGDRTPGVWLQDNRFAIRSAINGIVNYAKNINPPQQAGKWMNFEISQILINTKYMFEAKVDGISYLLIENNAATEFKNVKVFGSDNFYEPAHGKIKKLKIQTRG